MRRRVLVVLFALCSTWIVSHPSTADPAWAPVGSAAIHPGVQTVSPGGQCTANFVFFDADNVYLGQAAHCTSGGAATDTNGCTSPVMPLGTPVDIGGSRDGTLAYSSWNAMQAANENDDDTCAFNDFALVRIHPDDLDTVNPTIPHWGGPTGVNTAGSPQGSLVHSYGNSSLRQGLTLLSPKTGLSLGTDSGGWNTTVFNITPGIPGDSGSAVIDDSGAALGVLTTLGILPIPLSNGVGGLANALTYARQHGKPGLQLAEGTQPFNGAQLPLDL